MSLGITKVQISDSLFKNKEKAGKIKEKMNRFIWSIINASNNIEIELPPPNQNGSYFQYSFKIGPGNNSFVIRRLMNERWWWSIYDKQSSENMHFTWTQWRKNNIIDKLQDAKEFNKKFAKPSPSGTNCILTNRWKWETSGGELYKHFSLQQIARKFSSLK
jgi:hypothetical protein